VQTSLPSAHIPFVADAKIGEGVKAWRAGKYKAKSGGGDGGDSGSDGSGDESTKRKRSNIVAVILKIPRGTVVRRRV